DRSKRKAEKREPIPPFSEAYSLACRTIAAIGSRVERSSLRVNLPDRRSDPLVTRIDTLRGAVRQVRLQAPLHIDAWVVLPDHMHCLWTLPAGDADFPGRWRAIKTAFSKALPAHEP